MIARIKNRWLRRTALVLAVIPFTVIGIAIECFDVTVRLLAELPETVVHCWLDEDRR